MDNKQRQRLVERYVQLLDEGRLGDLDPILQAAERDAELTELITGVSEGYAEETGYVDSPEFEQRAWGRLKEVLAGSAITGGDSDSDGESRGVVPGPVASPEPRFTLIELDVERTDERPTTIAAVLGGTVAFFDDVNSYPHSVPERVMTRIIDLNEARFGIDRASTRRALHENSPLERMAASRDEAIEHEAPTFEEMLSRSGMSDEQKAYWRAVARGEE